MLTHTGRFAGKVVVVTGAAQGIGRTVALRVAREGGRLALIDRSDLVHDVQDEVKASGADAIAITADLETFEGASAALQTALSEYGRVDVLINNVGGTIWAKPYAAYEPAQIEAEIRRSLFPTLVVLPSGGAGDGGGGRGHGGECFVRRNARGESRSLRGGEGWGECHHRLPGDGIRRLWHPGLRCRTWWNRSPATAHSAQCRTAHGTRNPVVPAGRRSDGVIQSDETLRHHRGTGRGDPVPGL